MSERLKGKVAIVTGAGSSGPGVGTGKAASILFAREGASVLLVDRDADRARETLETIEGEGGVASVFAADVANAQQCEAAAAAAVERYGALHVLHNNVGIAGPIDDFREEDWDLVMEVNLKSMMLMSRCAVPRMIDAGGGSIINMSSISGLRASGYPASVPYSVSKGGAIALTTVMAVKHGRDNVRVNCIAPGHIYTPMVAGDMSDEMRERRRRAGPLGTEGTAWDVAWAALFLASDESRWVTGIVLPVEAGILSATPTAMLPHLL